MQSEFWGIARRRKFRDNEGRLQLHALALPKEVGQWSLTTTREKLVKSDFGSHMGNVG